MDLTNTHGNVSFQMLWENLEKVNVNYTIIKAIKQLHKDSVIKIKTGELVSKGFIVTKGLKQNFCHLFKIYVSNMP
jgi:hypothetical protein